MAYIEKAEDTKDAEIISGGKGDKTKGYFIEPTVIITTNPHFITMEEEIFGPVLTLFVYDDDEFEATLDLVDSTKPIWIDRRGFRHRPHGHHQGLRETALCRRVTSISTTSPRERW